LAALPVDYRPPAASVGDASVVEGNTGTTPATFTVSLSVAATVTTTVGWSTADATATAPSDYATASGTITFAPGVSTQYVTVNVNGDTTTEPNENFVVNLASPVNATIVDSQGVGTITDDDVGAPVVTGFTPTSGAVGGKTITVVGSSFTGATQVAFTKVGGGTVNATTFSIVDSGHINVKIPVGAITGPVSVTNASATGTSVGNFLVNAKIKTFSPTSGPVGTVVTITGYTLTGTTKVRFGTRTAHFTVLNDTTIMATVPAGAVTGPISITNAGGKTKTKTNFTVT
jgi:hypothetical protein